MSQVPAAPLILDTLPAESFPQPGNWFPSETMFTDAAQVLLAVVGGALDLYAVPGYARRFVTHGTSSVVPPDKEGQIAVLCDQVAFGKAGQNLYQFVDGAYGKMAFRVMRFAVELSSPWPVPRGGYAPGPAAAGQLREAVVPVSKAALIMFNALMALALGGVRLPSSVALPWLIDQNQMHMGPMVPVDPRGGMAVWRMQVEIEF